VAGIAGINPHIVTTGSVTFSRYSVQLNLQYEFDSRQIPSNDSSGYFPQNSYTPDAVAGIDYPGQVYGTEAFELNNNLKKRFVYLASIPKLNDTAGAAAYRATYGYAPANKPPSVVECDIGYVATPKEHGLASVFTPPHESAYLRCPCRTRQISLDSLLRWSYRKSQVVFVSTLFENFKIERTLLTLLNLVCFTSFLAL
jgi:hypothetical protein